jgi:peroxiredoxin
MTYYIRFTGYLFLLSVSLSFGHNIYSQEKRFNLFVDISGIDSSMNVQLELATTSKPVKNAVKAIKINEFLYHFSGLLDYPVLATIEVKQRRGSSIFFIDTGSQYIKTHFDSLRKPIDIIGSKTNKEYKEKFLPNLLPFLKEDSTWRINYRNTYRKFSGDIPAKILDSLLDINKSNGMMRDSLTYKYILGNPESYVGFWKLYNSFFSYGYTALYDSAFNLFKKLQFTYDAKVMRNTLIRSRVIDLNRQFPTLMLNDTSKVKRGIISFFKKYTLVDFWYSHCSPCISQFENLKNIYAEYSGRGFEIVGVSTDKKENELDWKKVIIQYKLPWKQLLDSGGKYATRFSINAFPTNFLLDDTGKIIRKDIDPIQLRAFLDNSLSH